MDLQAICGRSLIAFMIFPITVWCACWGFQDHCETTDALNQRRDICLATLLFKQHQIALPMPKLATMSDIVQPEQDADIAVKLRLLALASTAWRPVLAMQWQVSPQLLQHAFFGVDMPVDCLLTDTLFDPVKDHPIADRLRRPTVLEVFDHSVA